MKTKYAPVPDELVYRFAIDFLKEHASNLAGEGCTDWETDWTPQKAMLLKTYLESENCPPDHIRHRCRSHKGKLLCDNWIMVHAVAHMLEQMLGDVTTSQPPPEARGGSTR